MAVRERLTLDDLVRYAAAVGSILVEREVIGYAVALADATRNPAKYGLHEFGWPDRVRSQPARDRSGSSRPRACSRCLRGRGHVVASRHTRSRPDVLRHRIVLSYQALSEGLTPDHVLEQVLVAVPEPHEDLTWPGSSEVAMSETTVARAAARPSGSGARFRVRSWTRSTSCSCAWWRADCPGTAGPSASAWGTELAQLRPYELGDDVRHLDAAATARTGQPHVRLHVPERALTTWIVLDVSPSMAFGTADRLKADVAEGARWCWLGLG